MFNKLGYNERLEELFNAKKADDSIADVVRKNLAKQKQAKTEMKQVEKEITRLEVMIDQKKQEKSQISILKIKEFSQISREIKNLAKQLNEMLEKKELLINESKEAILQNSEIEQEIESQYKIYQENEIYLKVVERINESKLELSAEFYAGYVKHMEQYANAIYSFEKDSKLIEPNIKDLAALLNILRKSEEKQNNNISVKSEVENNEVVSEGKTVKEEKKTLARKKKTETKKKEDTPVEEKKTLARKKKTETEKKEETPAEEKKITTRKKKTETEKKDENPVEEKTKSTRKKKTETEKKDENLVEEKKKSTRKKKTETDKKEESFEEESNK